jgi:hypothetical protein
MTQANALPTRQDALNTIFEGVHARVFFNKCAAAGLVPSTLEEQEYMLKTAGYLRALEEAEQEKQAAAQGNFFQAMAQSLEPVLHQRGIQIAPYVSPEADIGIKRAADELANDPAIYNAVLSLKAHEAEQIRQETLGWQGQK